MKLTRNADCFDQLEVAPFNVPNFLSRPLVAHLVTRPLNIRPVWYLWEDATFWVLTGPWSGLERRLKDDPEFRLAIDICELSSGRVRQVIAEGKGTTTPFTVDRGRRKLTRYLGPNESRWDRRFKLTSDKEMNDAGVRWAKLVPECLIVEDQSFRSAEEDGNMFRDGG